MALSMEEVLLTAVAICKHLFVCDSWIVSYQILYFAINYKKNLIALTET